MAEQGTIRLSEDWFA